jgi:hypothetical protein
VALARAMSHEFTGKGILLKADPIAVAFRDEVKQSLAQCARPPKLVGILSTSSAPSKFYADFTKKQCDQLGVQFVLRKTGIAESETLGEGEGVEDAIIEANEDDSVDGIMACLPSIPLSIVFDIEPFFAGVLSNIWCSTGGHPVSRHSNGFLKP